MFINYKNEKNLWFRTRNCKFYLPSNQEKLRNYTGTDSSVILEDKDTEFSDLIENPCEELCELLNSINDIDKLLDSLTEDLRSSMVNDGFDPDDYKYWNACVIHNPLNLEGLLETFEGAIETLELFILETVRGYKILNQLAYDKNPRLPGLTKQSEKS